MLQLQVSARSAPAVRRLSILNVGYPFARVGRDAVGGAEQVLCQLDAALVRAGHDSLVIAPAGSSTSGRLFPIDPVEGRIDEQVRAAVHDEVRHTIEHVLSDEPIDVIHLHGIDLTHYLPRSEVPQLATLHLPPTWYPPALFDRQPPHLLLQCVSAAQRAACPAGARVVTTIPNGVSVEAFLPKPTPGSFVLMLGRICPEKGFHLGLEAAHRAGVDLLLAGSIHPYADHQRYFTREIEPRLDARRRFLGPVGFEEKARLYSEARCVLIPSLVPETSSLVAMEACASGTPVIAFSVGALPEIVEDGRTGFLVKDLDEMAAAIESAEAIDSEECLRTARERFSADRMAERYLELYANLAGASPPSSVGQEQADRIAPRHVDASSARAGAGAVRAGASGPQKTSVLSTLAELEALRPAWHRLWAADPEASPFQSPYWLIPWWRHFGGEGLCTLVRFGGEDLLLLAPLFIYTEPGSGIRQLTLLGNGISDQLGFLIRPNAGAAVEVILEHLRGGLIWDRADFRDLPVTSPLLRAHPPSGVQMRLEADDPCTFLELPKEPGELRGRIPLHFYKEIHRTERRAAELGKVRYQRVPPAGIDEALASLFRLHRMRWRERGGSRVLDDARLAAFHREVAHAFAAEGMLRLYTLSIGDRIAAAIYGFHAHGRTSAYLCGFDPAFRQCSPLKLLLLHAMERAILEGADEFDFLRGREAYKYAWGVADRAKYRVQWGTPGSNRGENGDQ